MNLRTLKIFNLGYKENIINGTCNFSNDAIWLVDGSTKLRKRGTLTSKDLASWWNQYIRENIHKDISLQALINEGLGIIKQTEFRETNLAISLVIAKSIKDKLEILLIGDCEALIGVGEKIKNVVKIDRNNAITKKLLLKMKNYSKVHSKPLLQTRKEIDEEMQKKVRGEDKEAYNYLRCTDNNITNENFLYKKVDIEDITHITLVNAGIMQYYQVFNIGNREEVYRYSISEDYLGVYDTIQKTEEKDLDCRKYPRIKPIRGCMLISVRVLKGYSLGN